MSDLRRDARWLVSSARAFLRHFNPCNLAEDKSQQWQALSHQCDVVERVLSAQPRPEAVEAVKELATRERFSQAALARIRKVRDEYANQAKFADVEPASYFREFIRRLDRAVDQKQSSPPWNGGAAPPLAPDARMRRVLERIRDDGPDHGVRWCRNIASEALRADDGKESEGGIMDAARKAQQRVGTWSDAKKDYAERATKSECGASRTFVRQLVDDPNSASGKSLRDVEVQRPTPAEQREAIARIICGPTFDELKDIALSHGPYQKYRDEITEIYAKADAILTLSTRAGG